MADAAEDAGPRRPPEAAGGTVAVADDSDSRAPEVRFRDPEPGDLGWLIHRQTALYAAEYGWDWGFEGVIAGIVGDFIAHYDVARDKAWIAELDGSIVGSVLLRAAGEAGTAKLRMLYVEPAARGRGIGRALVEACVAEAVALGYRRLTLSTDDVLTAARNIYRELGFTCVADGPHTTFGPEIVGETWTLDLDTRR